MMSAPRRCGSFWMMHWEKSRSRVWRSGTLASILEMLEVTISHCSWKNWLAYVGDPIGVPRRRKPVVISTRVCVAEGKMDF